MLRNQAENHLSELHAKLFPKIDGINKAIDEKKNSKNLKPLHDLFELINKETKKNNESKELNAMEMSISARYLLNVYMHAQKNNHQEVMKLAGEKLKSLADIAINSSQRFLHPRIIAITYYLYSNQLEEASNEINNILTLKLKVESELDINQKDINNTLEKYIFRFYYTNMIKHFNEGNFTACFDLATINLRLINRYFKATDKNILIFLHKSYECRILSAIKLEKNYAEDLKKHNKLCEEHSQIKKLKIELPVQQNLSAKKAKPKRKIVIHSSTPDDAEHTDYTAQAESSFSSTTMQVQELLITSIVADKKQDESANVEVVEETVVSSESDLVSSEPILISSDTALITSDPKSVSNESDLESKLTPPITEEIKSTLSINNQATSISTTSIDQVIPDAKAKKNPQLFIILANASNYKESAIQEVIKHIKLFTSKVINNDRQYSHIIKTKKPKIKQIKSHIIDILMQLSKHIQHLEFYTLDQGKKVVKATIDYVIKGLEATNSLPLMNETLIEKCKDIIEGRITAVQPFEAQYDGIFKKNEWIIIKPVSDESFGVHRSKVIPITSGVYLAPEVWHIFKTEGSDQLYCAHRRDLIPANQLPNYQALSQHSSRLEKSDAKPVQVGAVNVTMQIPAQTIYIPDVPVFAGVNGDISYEIPMFSYQPSGNSYQVKMFDQLPATQTSSSTSDNRQYNGYNSQFRS